MPNKIHSILYTHESRFFQSKADLVTIIADLATSYDLPPDVFSPGEIRPRPKKKGINKKRPHDTENGAVR